MNRNSYRSICLICLSAVLICILLQACANKGYPEGGPKDVTPPKVIAEVPASFNTNFKKKSVNIYFDEFVQLKNVQEKFIISPPQAKKPRVRLRAKYIMVEFEDTLRPNTNYSLDFADAIVDNNEGNPLGYYRYVFSTGNTLDSLELSGNVVDAQTNEPVIGSYVFLYSEHRDSVPLLQLPDYIARTDSSGFFRVTNLREADYKVLSVMDDNRDMKYTPEAEQVAFLDTLVRPLIMSVTRIDTLGGDSLVMRTYNAFGPNNLFLRMFQEKLTQLYMTDNNRKQRELLYFTFSIPGKNDFEVELLDTVVTDKWYFPEVSPGGDTVRLWIKDSTIYKRDTLNLKLSYLRSDSTGMWVNHLDTVRLVYADKEKEKNSRKRKKKEEEKPKIEFLQINVGVEQDHDLNKGIMLEFDRPVTEEVKEHIHLSEKVDTVYQPIDFAFRQDSTQMRRFYLERIWEPEKEYELTIDSAAISDIYGHINEQVEKKFKIRAFETYGKLMVTLKGVKGQVILQLYKPDSKKDEKGQKIFNVLDQKIVDKDSKITFDYLREGKYKLRAILDENGNGEWDTGLYMKGIQPEEIRYLPIEINVKQNFDVEQEFDLNSPYRGGEGKTKEEDKKPGRKDRSGGGPQKAIQTGNENTGQRNIQKGRNTQSARVVD